MRIAKFVAALIWIAQILAALAFIAIGLAKFRNPFWLRGFLRWGYSDSFRMLIGALEIIGGALLAWPRTTSYGAALLGPILIGAVATLRLHRENLFAPLFWLVIVAFVGIARRRRAWRPTVRGMAVPAERL